MDCTAVGCGVLMTASRDDFKIELRYFHEGEFSSWLLAEWDIHVWREVYLNTRDWEGSDCCRGPLAWVASCALHAP